MELHHPIMRKLWDIGGRTKRKKERIRYEVIRPHMNDTVNPLITNKPRLRAMFGSTIMKYAFTSSPQKMGVKGNIVHKHIMGQTCRQTKYDMQVELW